MAKSSKSKSILNKIIYSSLMVFLAASLCVGHESKMHRSDAYSMQYTVKITNANRGQCSGEQIKAPSGQTYILSAGHCRDIAINDNYTITTEDGRTLQRKFVAEDPESDLVLIEGIPNMGGLDIAKSSYKRQHVRTFTHGHGLDTYKTEGQLIAEKEVNIGVGYILTEDDLKKCSAPKFRVAEVPFGPFVMQVCVMSVTEHVTQAMVVPGSSGGMVVNDTGELVGVVSATDGSFGFLVQLKDIRHFLSGY